MTKRFGMKVKFFSLLMAGVLVLTACGGSGGSTGESQGSTPSGDQSGNSNKVIEMTWNNFLPSGSFMVIEAYEPWAKMVEEKTNGRVKVNLYNGAALGSSATMLKDITGGAYDFGVLSSSYEANSEFFPVTIADLPFATSEDVKVNTRILQAFAEKYLESMNKNVKVIGFTSSQAYYMFSRSKISSLDELKGKKIRALSDTEVDTANAIGAVPVSVTPEELYEALAKGILDIATTFPAGANDISMYEVAPFMIDMPYRAIQQIPVINKQFYESLPDDIKAIFDNELFPALVEMIDQAHANNASKGKSDFENLVQGKGGIVPISDDDVNRIKQLVKPVWDKWVEKANSKGYNGEQMLNEYKAEMEKNGLKFPF